MPPKTRKRSASTISGETGDANRSRTDNPPVVATAAASSSSSSTKYYFVTKDCHSYTLDELWSMVDALLAKADASKDADSEFQLVMPSGHTSMVSRTSLLVDRGGKRTSVPLLFGYPETVDWSRTSGQTECSLSLDSFVRPHILGKTGRSYSLDMFRETVAKTLEQGNRLPLEDITLSPLDLDDIKLYPNYSLPGWSSDTTPISFDFARVARDKLAYNFERIAARNVPEMSRALNTLSEMNDICVDGRGAREEYKKHRGTSTRVMEDLHVMGAVFPRDHIKDGPAFRNVLFDNCIMWCSCWCGIRFVGCKFKNCMFIYGPDGMHRADFMMCELESCTWIIQGNYAGESVPKMLSPWHGLKRSNCRAWVAPAGTFTAKMFREQDGCTLKDKFFTIHAKQYHLVDKAEFD